MKIIYLHHANRARGNPSTQADGITELGEKDAKLTAELLFSLKEKYNIVAIYSSEFFRCTKTAEIINDKLCVKLKKEPRFNEYKSMGEENWTACQTRITDAILDIVSAHADNEAIICLTSGLNIAPFLSLVYGIESNENVPFIGVLSCSPIILDIDKDKILRENRR